MRATNPYYQRVFSALAGTLARARAVRNEFQLVQRGFDLIGNLDRYAKYQLSCSDLTSDLEAMEAAAYFRAQKALELVEVRASLIEPSSSGAVTVDMTVNGTPLLAVPITIDAGDKSSKDAAVQPQLAITSIPDDAEFVVEIVAGGAGARGLIVSVIGRIGA
jgi:hypothetical protein